MFVQRDAGQTIGNEIWLGEQSFGADGKLTPSGLNLLVHEACHAWQYQHLGTGYLADSTIHQVRDGRGGVGTGGAYDWLESANAGVRFEDMTAERQAETVRYIDLAIQKNPAGVLTMANLQGVIGEHGQLSDGAFAIALEAASRVRNGS